MKRRDVSIFQLTIRDRDMKDYSGFLGEIRTVLPDERVYTDELRTLAWGTDASFYRLTPRVVIRA